MCKKKRHFWVQVCHLTGRCMVIHMACALAMAGGGGDCLNPGPDVIVRDIFQSHSYGSVGDRAAFALGTDACNIGDEVLNWIGGTNDHPLIGSSLHRLHDGRFEQIGMAWLKHGFGAAQEDTCGCDCVPGDWEHLGVGCSDAYSATTNGQQGISGSRFEVNPWTGAFVFPPEGWGESGDLIFRRLQVSHADLDPMNYPGAQYFAEVHFITPHDSAFNNQRNNYSTRRTSFVPSGGSWTMILEDETQAGQPALAMWQQVDPEVQLSEIEMPDHGRLLIAARVYPEANGWYRYEYAIQNLDHDLGVRSLRMPLSEWVTVENMKFHDVDYHSGDPILGTDWSYMAGDGFLEWSTDPWAVDPWANAIRWGTTYSFSLRANIQPVEGSIQLELFNAGDHPALTVDVPVPQHEKVDPCSLPQGSCPLDVTGDLVVSVNDVLAVLSHYGECGDGTWQPVGDVDQDCCVTVNDLLAVIAGWNDDCQPVGACCLTEGGCTDGLQESDCSDLGGNWRGEDSQCDSSNCPTAGGCCLQDGSCIDDLLPEACASLGGLHLSGGDDCSACPLMSDDCSSPQFVTEGEFAFDTRLATTDGVIHPECDTSDGGYTGNDIWMRFTPEAAGMLTLSTCSTADYDSDLVIYEGLECQDPVLLACNDDAANCANYTSLIEVAVVKKQEYLIRLGGWQEGSVGSGIVTISLDPFIYGGCCLEQAACVDDISSSACELLGGTWGGDDSSCDEFFCAAVIDDCADAATIVDGVHLFDTRQATTDGPAHEECVTGSDEGITGNDIWFRYTAAADGLLILSTCSTADYDTDIVVYDGVDCDSLDLLDCNDDAEGCEDWSSYLEVTVSEGDEYLIRLGGWIEGSIGTGLLFIGFLEGEPL